MALSYVTYTGTGPQTDYTFPFLYISPTDVFVIVNGVSVAFTFINSSAVRCAVPPAAGASIQVRRLTAKLSVPVDFTDGSNLLERDLDLLGTWTLYQAQESGDVSSDLLGLAGAPLNSAVAAAVQANVSANAAALSAAQMATAVADLASTTNPIKGAGQIGYNSALTYPGGTVGAAVGFPILSLKIAGAVGDGTTDNLAAINSAISSSGRQKIIAQPGTYLVASNPTNPYGVEFDGPGAVVKAITGGQQQLNSYADLHKYVIGKEYMHRVYARLNSGFTGPVLGVGIKTFCYGDSTIAGTNVSAGFLVQNYLPLLCRLKGLRVPMNVVNRGVSGTKITDMSALGDLSTDTDLFIIKYGINDGMNADATRLSTFATSLRGQLAAIRGATFGTVSDLTIILMGPNSTSDTPNGRDERWYEQLRGIYVRAARDYNCVYFDTYAWLKDSRPAAGLWMDNPYGDGRAVHPGNAMTAWIWGGLFQAVFSSDDTAPWRVNHVVNTSGNWDTPAPAALPNSYDFGVSMRRAAITLGWPIDGVVMTLLQMDNSAVQFLFSFKPGNSVVAKRISASVSNTWGPWSGVPIAIPLSNGWVTYGAPYGAPSAVLADSGIVTVNMIVKSGTTALGTVIGTLPASMSPAAYAGPFPATSSAGAAVSIRINSTGAIELNTVGDGTYTSFCCSFPAAQAL